MNAYQQISDRPRETHLIGRATVHAVELHMTRSGYATTLDLLADFWTAGPLTTSSELEYVSEPKPLKRAS